jgi:hypothetical protein
VILDGAVEPQALSQLRDRKWPECPQVIRTEPRGLPAGYKWPQYSIIGTRSSGSRRADVIDELD